MKISKGIADEVFVIRDLGILVQIASLIDVINETQDLEPSWLSTDALRSIRRSDRVDEVVIAAMAEDRRDEPILVCELADELWLIDGNHRLEKRHRDGLLETQAIDVPPTILVPCIQELGF